MPHITINNASLYYEEHGSGEETIVFSHGLLWSGAMFEQQVHALKDKYRIITYDHRGQGKSAATKGGYDIETLTLDAMHLIQQLVGKPCHFVGLSMGGFVGMRLALRYPNLIRSLVLMETSAEVEEPESIKRYHFLARLVNIFGFAGFLARQVMPIMFGPKFLNDPARKDLRQTWEGNMKSNRKSIVPATFGMVGRNDIVNELPRITCPTLIIVGEHDAATPPKKSEKIHAHIKGSQLVIIPGAGHTSTVEEPALVNTALLNFFESLEA